MWSSKSSVFNDFLNSDRDVEERTASDKLFQTEVAPAAKPLPPMVAQNNHNRGLRSCCIREEKKQQELDNTGSRGNGYEHEDGTDFLCNMVDQHPTQTLGIKTAV